VTGGTGAGLPCDRTVIKSAQPGRGVMAVLTGLGGNNMGGPLTGSNHGVMAVLTGVRGLGMIKG